MVHYPLFARVGTEIFTVYEAEHMSRVTLIVLPAMFIELMSAIALVILPPPLVPHWMMWVGLVLVLATWLVTAFVNVPQHTALASGFDVTVHQGLVTTNWIRTLLWTLRALIMLYALWLLLNPPIS